jgi:hypothetical protein
MKRVLSILMERDGMSREEAVELIREYKVEFNKILNNGGSYDEAQTLMEDYFGLEPDYIEDFV